MRNRKFVTVWIILLMAISSCPQAIFHQDVAAETVPSFEITDVTVSSSGDLEFVLEALVDVPALEVANNGSYTTRIDGVSTTSTSILAGESVVIAFRPPNPIATSEVVGFTFKGSGQDDVITKSLLMVSDESLLKVKENLGTIKEIGASAGRTISYSISDQGGLNYFKYDIVLERTIRTNQGDYDIAYVTLGIKCDGSNEAASINVSLDKYSYIKFPSDQEDLQIKLAYTALFLQRFYMMQGREFENLLTSVEVWDADVHNPILGFASSVFNGFGILCHQSGDVVSSLVVNPAGGGWQSFGTVAAGTVLDFAGILAMHGALDGRLWELGDESFSEELLSGYDKGWDITDEIAAMAFKLHLTLKLVKSVYGIALEGVNELLLIKPDMTLEQIEQVLLNSARHNDLEYLSHIVGVGISSLFEELVLGSLYDAVAAYYLSITAVNHASRIGKELDIMIGPKFGMPGLNYPVGDVLGVLDKWMAFCIMCTALIDFIDTHLSILARPDIPEARAEWQQAGQIAKRASELPAEWLATAKRLIGVSSTFQESSTVIVEKGSYLVYPYKDEGEVTILPELRSALKFDQIFIETDDSNLPGGEALGLSILQNAIDSGFNLTLLSLGGPAVNVLSRGLNEELGRELGVQFLYNEKDEAWMIEDRGVKVGEQVTYYAEDGKFDYAIIGLLNIKGSRVGLAAGIGWEGTKGVCLGLATREPDLFSFKEDHVFLYKVPKDGSTPVQLLHRSCIPSSRLPWDTARGFVDSGVSPPRGLSSTQFVFATTYIDAGGETPARVAVSINTKFLTMTCVSPAETNPRLGLRYEARWSGFEAGGFECFFAAYEGVDKLLTRSSFFTFHVGRSLQAPEPEPWVRIDSPIDGSFIHGTTTISVSGGDFSGAPVRLYYCIDNEPFTEVSGPVDVNTNRFANGTHTLTAQARGGQGKYREATVRFTIDNPPFDTPKLGLPDGVRYQYTANSIELKFRARNIGQDGYVSVSSKIGSYSRGPTQRWMDYREEVEMTFVAPISAKDTALSLKLYDESTGTKEEVWDHEVTVPSNPDVKARIIFDKPAYFVGDRLEVTFILDSNYEPVPEWSTALFQVSWGLRFYESFPEIEITSQEIWQFTYSALVTTPGPVRAYGFIGAFNDGNSSNNHVYESVTVHAAGKAVISVDTYSPARLLPGGLTGDTPRPRKDVEILIDGHKRGTTDDRGRVVIFTSPGTHTVRVKYDSTMMTRTCSVAEDEVVQLVFFSMIPDIGVSPRLSIRSTHLPDGNNETLTVTVDVLPDPDGDIRQQPGARIFGEPILYAGPRSDLAFIWFSTEEVSTNTYKLSIDTSQLREGNYTAWLAVDDSHHVKDATLRALYEGYLNYSHSRLFFNFSVFHPPKCVILNLVDGQRVSGTILAKIDTGTVDPDRSTLMMKFGSDDWERFLCVRTFEQANVSIDTTLVEDGRHTLAFILINERGLNSTVAVRLLVCNDGWALEVRSPKWAQMGVSALHVTVVDNLGFAAEGAEVELSNGDWSQTRYTEVNGTILLDALRLGPYSVVASYPGIGTDQTVGVVLDRLPHSALVVASFATESGLPCTDAVISLSLEGAEYNRVVVGDNLSFITSVASSMFIGGDFRIKTLDATLDVELENISQSFSFILVDGAMHRLDLTLFDLPPTAPSWVTVAYGTDGKAVVAWEPNGDADFGRYEVLIGILRDGEPVEYSIVTIQENRNTTTCELTDLSRGENYSIIVRAVDVFDRTNSSEPASLSVPSLGNDCSIVLTMKDMGETWALIDWTINASDEPLHCTIYLSTTVGSLGPQYGDTFGVEVEEVNITGLSPATEYHIRILVHFNDVDRIISEPLSVQTLEEGEPPDEPPGVAIDLLGECYLSGNIVVCDLSWTVVNLGEFGEYEIYYRESGSIRWLLEETISTSTTTRHSIMDLQSGQTYEFKVRVNTINDVEYWSNILTLTTPNANGPPEPQIPEHPWIANVSEVDNGELSLDIEWDWPFHPDFTRFTIFISTHLGELGISQWSGEDAMVQDTTISSVEHNKDYYITVRVHLSNGIHLDSEQYHFKTSAPPEPDDSVPVGAFAPMLAMLTGAIVGAFLRGRRRKK